MKKFVYIAVAIIVLSASIYFVNKSQSNITNYPSSGTDIIAFGDSLVEGVGSEDGGFVKMLSQDLGIPIINLGVSGNITKDALNRIGEILRYDPKVVILLLGGNDFLRKVPEEEIFNNLDRIIEAIHQTGAVVLLLGVKGNIISNRHEKLFEELAEKRGTAYIPNVLEGVFGKPGLMYDNFHPNDAGYRIIADKVRPVLKAMVQ